MNIVDVDAQIKKYTYAVYILQALSFLVLFTAVLGVILNYIKDDDTGFLAAITFSLAEKHFLVRLAVDYSGYFDDTNLNRLCRPGIG